MRELRRIYFGPLDDIELNRDDGLSFPEGHPLQGLPNAVVEVDDGAFALIYLGRGKWDEAEVHFLIRLVEGLSTLSGIPTVPAAKMDAFMDALREFLVFINGIKDGLSSRDISQALVLIDRIRILIS